MSATLTLTESSVIAISIAEETISVSASPVFKVSVI